MTSQAAARRSVAGFNPKAKEHSGFLGFGNLKVIIDEKSPIVKTQMPPVYYKDTLAHPSELDVSFSLVEGDGEGLFIPEGFDDDLLRGFDGSRKPETEKINRSAGLIHSVRPTVPWLARENKKEGYVEVLMLIDRTGRPAPFACEQPDDSDKRQEFVFDCKLKDGSVAALRFFVDTVNDNNTLLYVVLKEDPKEYSFAAKLIEKLPEWVFQPAIRDNEPIEQFVILRFRYCDPRKEDCREIVLSNVS